MAGSSTTSSIPGIVLLGDLENETLTGFGGDDSIDGMGGNDSILGGIGDNTLLGGTGEDTLLGGEDDDCIDGGEDNDLIFGGHGLNTLSGGDGNDVIWGGRDADVIFGGNNDDILQGLLGNDTLDGGSGHDQIFGGIGNDSIDAGTGNDTVQAGADDDTVNGGDGNDLLFGGYGDNLVNGGDGNDELWGGRDSDSLFGDGDNDTLYGLGGDDEIDGGDGNDSLLGGNGADSLTGGDGNDTIVAGADNDTIIGGAGDDSVLGGTGEDLYVVAGSILDFSFTRGALSDQWLIQDFNALDGDQGVDNLRFVEQIQFDDYTLALDGSDNAPLVIVDPVATTDEDTALTFTTRIYDFDPGIISVAPGTLISPSITLSGNAVLTSGASTPIFSPLGSAIETTFTIDPNNQYETLGGSQMAAETLSVNIVANTNPLVGFGEPATPPGGDGSTTTVTVPVTITGVNDLPVLVNPTENAIEDTPATINALALSSDPEGGPLQLGPNPTAVNGTVTVSGSNLIYTPDSNFFGSDTISYEATDQENGVSAGTIQVLVDGRNDDPTALNDTASTDEDTALNLTEAALLTNDSDIDSSTLSISGVGLASNGSVQQNIDGSITYTPNLNFNGMDSFEYTVSDGAGGTDTATVNVTVNPINDGPTTVPDTAATNEDTAVTFDVDGNDSDPESNSFTITGATALNGSVTIESNFDLTYTPNANYNGVDTITYTATDELGAANTGTASVTVAAVNDRPTVLDASTSPVTANDDALITVDLLARAADVDVGDTLTVIGARLVDPNTGALIPGVVTVTNGVASFDPAILTLADGASQSLQIEYQVQDDSGAANDDVVGYVNVTVTGVVDPTPPASTNTSPTAGVFSDFNVRLESSGLTTLDLSTVVSDVDVGDMLSITSFSIVNPDGTTASGTPDALNPLQVTVDLNDLRLNASETRIASFAYTVDDGSGEENATALGTGSFLVQGDATPPDPLVIPNSQPTAADLVQSVDEANGPFLIDLNTLVGDSDVGDVLTFSNLVEVTMAGGLVFDGQVIQVGGAEGGAGSAGIASIDPEIFGLDTGETQPFYFSYTVFDDSGESNASNSGQIQLVVTGEDEPIVGPGPVILDFEEYADPEFSSIAVKDFGDFVTEGALGAVIETDEISSDPRAGTGIALGQTTSGGSNILQLTPEVEVTVNLDSFGEPIIDPITRLPETTTVISTPTFYSADTTSRIGDASITLFGNAGTPPEALFGTRIGTVFDLQSLSLNLASGAQTVTLKTYEFSITEAPIGNGSFVNYTLDSAVADTFEFAVDGTTAATELDFTDVNLLNTNNVSNTAAFTDIFAFTIETADGSPVIIDDLVYVYDPINEVNTFET